MKRIVAVVGMWVAAVALMVTVSRSEETLRRPRIKGIIGVQIYTSDPKATDGFFGKLNVLMGSCRICGWKQRAALLPNGQEIITWNPDPKPGNNVAVVTFEIDDVSQMAGYLKTKRIPFEMELPVDGDRYLVLNDPEGHEIHFSEFGQSYGWWWEQEELKKAGPTSIRLLHAGWVVKDREAMDRFYRDVLGFHLYWQGGMKDDRVDWVSMQVPDGTDWIEYMLNIPPDASKHLLGVMNHIALGVPSVREAAEQLKKNGVKLPEEPKIGRDGKWQLNLYDPDDTRVELMEFTPVEKPCCSEFTGTHPKP